MSGFLKLKKQMDTKDYYNHNPGRLQIENRLGYLLDYGLPEKQDELIRFQKRLKKYRDYIFTFLYKFEVPPDNNASERAIRNIKVYVNLGLITFVF